MSSEKELIEQAITHLGATGSRITAGAIDWRDEHGPDHELPQPGQPMHVARALAWKYPDSLTWWRGDFYRHVGTHWTIVPDAEVTRWLYWQTENSYHLGAAGKDGKRPMKLWAPNRRRIADVQHALGYGLLQRTGDAHTALALTNGVLMSGRRLAPHSEERFNLASLPFAYDPTAGCPAWLDFLNSTLPDDEQSQDFLGEWFGYVLSGRTSQQKMAALIGERRSGKGTIARVLTAMMGRENVAGLDLPQLGTTFGRQGLIGKALAISGDVRWHSRTIGDAVPALLQVIGEDTVSVPRKNREDWNGRLGVRFLMMSNDTPTFTDRSGALSGRMIYVRFGQSFYGKEDIGLTDRLLGELPGILNWALDGLDRLDRRGRFTQPESGEAEAEAVRRLSDPIGAFLDDWCVIGEDESIWLDDLYGLYRKWSTESGRDRDSTTKDIFSREIRSKIKVLASERRRVNGKQVTMLRGVGSAVVSAESWNR